MKDDISRFSNERMTYYRETYLHSTRWQGESLTGKTIIVYMEQGTGDQIMFLRFLRFLDANVIVHGDKGLERIVKNMGHSFLSKEDPNLPDHHFHVCSLSLPFILQKPIPVEPFIKVETKKEIPAGWNVGIAWEGNPDHPLNDTRSCMLKCFKPLASAGMNLYHLQPSILDNKFIEGASDMQLYGIEVFNDWFDTAELINAVNSVITIDTGVLHLAGAMGKKTVALLGPGTPDARWSQLWYPSVKFVKGSWEECIEKALSLIQKSTL